MAISLFLFENIPRFWSQILARCVYYQNLSKNTLQLFTKTLRKTSILCMRIFFSLNKKVILNGYILVFYLRFFHDFGPNFLLGVFTIRISPKALSRFGSIFCKNINFRYAFMFMYVFLSKK